MLTRPEVDEAEAEANANSHEAEAKIALFFQPNFTFWPNFVKKTRPRGQAGRGRGHNCHQAKAEAKAINHEAKASFFGPRGRSRDEDLASL